MQVKSDPFNLRRFREAQAGVFETALAELKRGQKSTHWMWYIFPQIEGLGNSAMTHKFSVKSLEEAREYLSDPVLGGRLIECVEAILSVEGRTAAEIMGHPDDKKLKSSMTLFEAASPANPIFGQVLEKYFGGERDQKTLSLLENQFIG
jgi:uncharacterized protein (DUF1810 family)